MSNHVARGWLIHDITTNEPVYNKLCTYKTTTNRSVDMSSPDHCLLYKLAGFQSFQETFFIKMNLSHDHFYKTIEEAETAMKQYSKIYFFSSGIVLDE